MKKITLLVLSSLTALSLVVAGCGKSSSSSSKTSPVAQAQVEVGMIDGSHIKGHYQATFITLNSSVNGTIPGSANFFRKEEKIFAYVRLFAGKVSGWHQQFVYTGGRCPTMSDDANADGFIDIIEAEKVLGKILIPLDSDISSQSSGKRLFPLADLSGSYAYERITSFKSFLRDLQEKDPDPSDDIVKLAPDEPLNFLGKTVLILGVDEQTVLPDTVATKGRFRAFHTFPIVCGVFQKGTSAESIGEPYSEDSIGPVAEVEEGQDTPAPERDNTTTEGDSTSTGGAGTGTNENEEGEVSDGRNTTGNSSSGSTSGNTTGSTNDDENNTGTSSGWTGGRTDGGNDGTTAGGTTTGTTSGGSNSGSGNTTGGTSDSGGSRGGDETNTSSTSSSSSSSSTGTSDSSTTTSTASTSSSSSTTGGFLGF